MTEFKGSWKDVFLIISGMFEGALAFIFGISLNNYWLILLASVAWTATGILYGNASEDTPKKRRFFEGEFF